MNNCAFSVRLSVGAIVGEQMTSSQYNTGALGIHVVRYLSAQELYLCTHGLLHYVMFVLGKRNWDYSLLSELRLQLGSKYEIEVYVAIEINPRPPSDAVRRQKKIF